MPDLSRRTFLAHASLGVAAGVAAASGIQAVPQLLQAAGVAATPATPPDLTPLGDDLVAHVRDASRGDVALLVGTREVVYHDPELVGRLLQGARRAGQES